MYKWFIGLFTILLGVGMVWAATYSPTTTARQENVLDRAILTLGGTTKDQLIQQFVDAGIRKYAQQQSAEDKRVYSEKYDVATTEGRVAADAELTSTIVPPVVQNPGNRTNAVGNRVTLQIVASDPDGKPMRYSATNLPVGLAIGPSGLIEGLITADTGSPFASTVTVLKFIDVFTTVNFTWTVNP